MQIANLLAKERGIRLMLTGGTVTVSEMSLVGDLADHAFSGLRFDTFIMGVGGFDVDAGCTEFNQDDARVKRAALASVRRCIVVADSAKLGKVTFARICPLDRVDVLVTDEDADKEELDAYETQNVEVVVS